MFAAFLFLLLPGYLMASTWQTFGVGSRDMAMGQAVTSLIDDGTAAFYNPAALTLAEKPETAIGWVYAKPYLNFDGGDTKTETNQGINIIAVIPTGPVSAGILAFLPDQEITRGAMVPNYQPRYALYGYRNRTLSIAVSLGFKLADWISLGVGGLMLSDLYSKTILTVDLASTDIPTPVVEADLEVTELPQTTKLMAGLLIQPFDSLRVGAAWREETSVYAESPVILDLNIIDTPIMTFAGMANFGLIAEVVHTPQSASLGISYDFTDEVTLAFDLWWIDWSGYPNPTPISSIEQDPILSVLMPETTDAPRIDPDFKDIYIPRFAVDYLAYSSPHLEINLRGGYFFQESPVRRRSAFVFVDSDTHALSFGTGFTLKDVSQYLDEPLSFDFHFQYRHLEERNIDPPTYTNVFGDFTADGYIINTGITMTLRW